ncbi:MAG: TldD/PmbA family protein [Candidatus Hodarchaeales archaeon]|jgi:TldD protein
MEDLTQAAIEAALKTGVSFVDVRIENTHATNIEFTDGITKKALASRLKGAGIRAFVDGAWAFAQTSDLTAKGMCETAESAAKLALATREKVAEKFVIEGPSFRDNIKIKVKKSLMDISVEEKIAFTRKIDDQARKFDNRIINTRTVYVDLWTKLYVANSIGTSVWIENSLPRILSYVTAKDGVSRHQGHRSVGAKGGFEEMEKDQPQHIGEETGRLVIDLLASVPAKGGVFDIIMDPILNGVMIHEAFGHACEADNWPAHSTVLEDKVGKAVGPEYLSISDDPTLPNSRGSFEYDWEGTKTKKRQLVHNGVLIDLLHSLETASRLDMEPNGAARAQNFTFPPIPRMSNTFMEPGDWDVDELIADTKNGILVCSFQYGYTEPAKGQFNFKAHHGYIIENGEKGQMISDVSIAGQILEVLAKVDAIAKDFSMEAGTCGKNGQGVPDYSGGPHARIRNMPLGGV